MKQTLVQSNTNADCHLVDDLHTHNNSLYRAFIVLVTNFINEILRLIQTTNGKAEEKDKNERRG